MSQKTTGLYRFTQVSDLYESFQQLLGADRARQVLVDEYIRPFAGARVLDLGCGPAAVLPMLGPVDYVGIDANVSHIAGARRRHAGRGRFIADDFACLKGEEAGRFDVVLCLGLLHHLDDQRVSELAGLARSYLKPSGRFVALDPAFTDDQHPIARWLAAADSGQCVRPAAAYGDLVRPAFGRCETVVRHDLARLPYTHCITSAKVA